MDWHDYLGQFIWIGNWIGEPLGWSRDGAQLRLSAGGSWFSPRSFPSERFKSKDRIYPHRIEKCKFTGCTHVLFEVQPPPQWAGRFQQRASGMLTLVNAAALR
jgi:hypothetical protein